jgi:prepilin-type N-terminal cleavage/methylation domain-containing protein
MRYFRKGFSFVEIIIVLVVIGLIGGLGYVGWKAFTRSETPAVTDRAKSGAAGQSAEVITTKADLEAAEKALNDLDFDDDNARQAETQANL